MEVILEEMVAGHFVDLAALLVQPEPQPAMLRVRFGWPAHDAAGRNLPDRSLPSLLITDFIDTEFRPGEARHKREYL